MRVHPAMVPADHPLASVRDSFNAVFVEGEAVGDLMFYGRGAGGGPTASAVLGDLIDAAVNRAKGSHASVGALAKARIRPIDEVETAYYLNLDVVDRPGVLAAVAGVFGDHGVSIRSMEQEGLGGEARLVFITHVAREADVQATIRDLHHLDAVDRITLGAAGRGRRGGPVKYVSTRGQAPVLDFARRAAGRPRPPTAGCTCPRPGRTCPSGWDGPRPYPELAADVLWPYVEGSSLPPRRARRPGPRGLRHLRPPRRVPAGGGRARPLRGRAVPRAHAGVQGRGPPAGGPAVRPRADPRGASGPRSWSPPRATPARPPSPPAWAGPCSTWSCSTPRAGCPTCSAAR